MLNLNFTELIRTNRFVPIDIKRYLSEKPEVIFDLLGETGLNLLVSPTGTGKTVANMLTSTKFCYLNDGKIVVLLAPTRSLAAQVGIKEIGITELNDKKDLSNVEFVEPDKDYLFTAPVISVYGGVDLSEINFESVKFVSCVYDRAEELFNHLSSKYKKEIIVIVDEAHEIYKADYRKDAIDSLERALKNNLVINTIFMTATSDILTIAQDNNFNKIVRFNVTDRPYNADKLTIYRYDGDYKNTLLRAVIERLEDAKKNNEPVRIVMRFNNSTEAEIFKNNILTEYDVKILNSKMKDVSDEFKSIVEEEKLTDCDLLITTSLIDAGVSIQNDYNLIWFFVSTHLELDIDNIKQSFNRPRNLYKEAVLFIRNKIGFSELSLEERENKTLKLLNGIKECVSDFSTSSDEIIASINSITDTLISKENAEIVDYLVLDEKKNTFVVDNKAKARCMMHSEATKTINFKGKLKQELSYLSKNIEEIIITQDDEMSNEIFIKEKTSTTLKEARKAKLELRNEFKSRMIKDINKAFDVNVFSYINTLDNRKAKETYNAFNDIFLGSSMLGEHQRKHYFNAFNGFYKALLLMEDNSKGTEDNNIDYVTCLDIYTTAISNIFRYYSNPKKCLEVTIKKVKEKDSFRVLSTIKNSSKYIKLNEFITSFIEVESKIKNQESYYNDENKNKYVEEQLKSRVDLTSDLNDNDKTIDFETAIEITTKANELFPGAKQKKAREEYIDAQIEKAKKESSVTVGQRRKELEELDRKYFSEKFDKEFKPTINGEKIKAIHTDVGQLTFLIEFRKIFDTRIQNTVSVEFVEESIKKLQPYSKELLTIELVQKNIRKLYNVPVGKDIKKISSLKTQIK